MFGVDTRLIEDGTYFVAEAGGVLAGCARLEPRKTLFGADRGAGRRHASILRTMRRDPGVLQHPEWSRRGIGSLLLETCEQDAARAGFQRFELKPPPQANAFTACGAMCRLIGWRRRLAMARP